MDEFDSAWGSTGGESAPLSQGSVRFEPQPIAMGADSFDALWDNVQAPQVNLLGSDNPSPLVAGGRAMIGATSKFLPFGDEVTAGGASTIDAIRSLFGGPQVGLSDAYDQRLNEIRNYQQAAEEASPLAAGVVDVAGALALPLKSKVPGLTGAGKYVQAAKEGGAIGALFGFDKAEGGFENRAVNAAKSSAFSAAVSPAATAIADLFGGALSKASKQLDRKSIGASYGDYLKSADDLQRIDLPEGDLASKAKLAIDDLLENGKLGSTRDPAKLVSVAQKESEKLSYDIGALVNKFDEVAEKPVYPTFNKAMQFLTEGKVPADQIDKYATRLANLERNIANEGRGTLSFLQQQKIAIGNSYDAGDSILNKFNRAIYHDLQETIERAVPSIKPLNNELSKWKVVEPILKRSLAKAEGTDPISKAQNLWRTSGGFGVPILLAQTTAGPVGAAGAAATSLLTTAKGQQVTAKVSGLASKIDQLPFEKIVPALVSDPSSQKDSPLDSATLQKDRESRLNQLIEQARGQKADPNSPQTGKSTQKSKRELEYPEGRPSPKSTAIDSLFATPKEAKSSPVEDLFGKKLVKAVISQESNGKADAVSNKGAVGLMQVMPETAKEIAKELGVKNYDLKDPETNKKFGTYYLNKLLDMFDGDLELALTSYHSGPGRVKELLKLTGGDSLADIKQFLGPVGKKYASGVISKLRAA